MNRTSPAFVALTAALLVSGCLGGAGNLETTTASPSTDLTYSSQEIAKAVENLDRVRAADALRFEGVGYHVTIVPTSTESSSEALGQTFGFLAVASRNASLGFVSVDLSNGREPLSTYHVTATMRQRFNNGIWSIEEFVDAILATEQVREDGGEPSDE